MRFDDVRIYMARYEVQSPIIFSSRILPGKPAFVYTTSEYLHNYPLIYALQRVVAESYAVATSMKELEYRTVRAVIKAVLLGEHDAWLDERGIETPTYVYPPVPDEIHRVQFYTGAGPETYGFRIGSVKYNFPRNVVYNAIAPPSRYHGLVISLGRLPREMFVELGMKRFGSMKITLYEVERSDIVPLSRPSISSPVNVGDTKLMQYSTRNIVVLLSTKVRISWNPQGNVIGIVKAENLYRVRKAISRNTVLEVVVPLPKHVVERIGVHS